MTYTANQIREKAQYYGEFMLVLESDREYDFHNFTVTFGEDESSPALSDDELRIEGVMDGEHLVVDIPIERIEHVYAHREL
jgi:hypothetical protein